MRRDEAIGKKVKVSDKWGNKICTGLVEDYFNSPSYAIRTDTGELIHWRTELTEEIPHGKKCLVKECPNREGEGRMVGPLCSPCATALEGGKDSVAARDRIRASLAGDHPTYVASLSPRR